MKNLIIKIKKQSDNILEQLGFDAESIVIQQERVLMVKIQTEDKPSLLIGRGGETLEALQHILRLLHSKDIARFDTGLVIDIAGYRDRKIERAKKGARDKAYQVLVTGMEEVLPPMPAFERRVVHTVCTNIADVETESTGQGRERRVVIKPKKADSS